MILKLVLIKWKTGRLKKMSIDTEKIKYVINDGYCLRFFNKKGGRPIEIAWWGNYNEMVKNNWERYDNKFWYMYKEKYEKTISDYLKSLKYKDHTGISYYSNFEMAFDYDLGKMIFLDEEEEI